MWQKAQVGDGSRRREAGKMNWYAEQAMEIHRERMREVERYFLLQQAQAELKRDTGPGRLDKSLLVLGQWMVSAGKRLQARHTACMEQVTALNIPLSTLTK
jgi:hypothetical protein